MYNTDLPRRADLPTSAQLMKSSLIALASASVILTIIVLPSEYAIDPTGIGRMLGLTQMGEIKAQLSEEASQDRAQSAAAPQVDGDIQTRLDRIEQKLDQLTVAPVPADRLAALIVEPELQAPTQPEAPAAPLWRDEVSFSLVPGEGAEIKLAMDKSAQAEFYWTANGAIVNYDTHGDGGGNAISYEKGRGVPEQEGTLTAAFTGNHGWFWRNRTNGDVTVTLRTRGEYRDIKRLK